MQEILESRASKGKYITFIDGDDWIGEGLSAYFAAAKESVKTMWILLLVVISDQKM